MNNEVLSQGAHRILEVAAHLFARQGYAGVSINDIAAEVGVSKANVFHHFASKEALYLAVIDAACDEFKTELECLKNHERDVALGLKQVACQHLMRLLSNPDPARLVLREVFKGESGIDSSQVAKILHRNFALLVEQIERGQVSGQFRRDTDPAMVAVTLIAQNIFFFQSWEILRQFPEFQNLDCAERLSVAAFDSLSKGLFAK